jgi:hypothetical protein
MSIAMSVVGLRRRHARWVWTAAAVMFAETLVVFTISPLTLANALIFAYLAATVPSRNVA